MSLISQRCYIVGEPDMAGLECSYCLHINGYNAKRCQECGIMDTDLFLHIRNFASHAAAARAGYEVDPLDLAREAEGARTDVQTRPLCTAAGDPGALR